MQQILNELKTLSKELLASHNDNKQCIEYIINTLDKLTTNEDDKENHLHKLEEHEHAMQIESDMLIKRRIELHKERPPVINPLSRLSIDEKDRILKKIFNDAVFNVETIMNIAKTDNRYDEKINEEADRLLNVWLEASKIKSI
jgi:hypothetical protein